MDATITSANFNAAQVRGADFSVATYFGFTAAQLYSTASYQDHDLAGLRLKNTNLSGWSFAGQNLANTDFYYATLTNADFSHANLTSANLASTALAGANFTGAQLRGAYLPGLTAAQLYSTASYQNKDLSGIVFDGYDVSALNFAAQNLTHAGFFNATLGSADFNHANLTNASFAYLADDDIQPFGDNLSLANFSYANLTNANLAGCTLTGANFTGAQVRGASFAQVNRGYGFWTDSLSAAQLYSTASYQNHDLSGIRIVAVSLAGWNFAGQKLTNAYIYSYGDAGIYTAADTRGAQVTLPGASSTTNLILPNGHVAGLNLTAGQSLLVRNYHGNPALPDPGPIPIHIEQSLAMDSTGALRLIFDADAWDSGISFAPGIPVTLGGMLDLSFAGGVDINAEVGRTFQIFDWTGVTPTGSFSLSSPYDWDISKLYTSGQVTLIPEPGSLALLAVAGIAPLLSRRFNRRRAKATP